MSKLRSEAFPYPVLTNDEDGDYDESLFDSEITLQIKETENNIDDELEVKYQLTLENTEINELISKGEADFAILVISSSTGFRELFYTNKNVKGSFSIKLVDVYGNIEFEPQIIIRANKVRFTSRDLNNEFQMDNSETPYFNLSKGDPIAFSDTIIKNISFEPLRLESLIVDNEDTSLDPNVYSIDPSNNDRLIINMGEQYFKKWRDRESRKFLISCVFKDVILFALKEYLDNKEDVEQKRWASLIIEKFKDVEENQRDLKDDFDKLNRIALQIAAKYTLDKITETKGE